MKKLFCFLVMVFFFFSSIPPGDADMTRQLKRGYTKAQVDALLAAYCLESVFGDATEADDFVLSGTTLSLVGEIPHLDVAETVSGNWDFTANPHAVDEGGSGASTAAGARSAFDVAPMNISFTYNGMIATDDFLFGRAFTQACTVTNYGGILHSGTNIVGKLYICDGTNDLNDPMDIAGDCDACDSADITFDGGEDREAAPDGVVAVGVGDRLGFVANTVVAPGFFVFDVNLTVD